MAVVFVPPVRFPDLPGKSQPDVIEKIFSPYKAILTQFNNNFKAKNFKDTIDTLYIWAKNDCIIVGKSWRFTYAYLVRSLLDDFNNQKSVATKDQTKLICSWFGKIGEYSLNSKEGKYKNDLYDLPKTPNNEALLKAIFILNVGKLIGNTSYVDTVKKFYLNTFIKNTNSENVYMGDISRGDEALMYTTSSLSHLIIIRKVLNEKSQDDKFKKILVVYNKDVLNDGVLYAKYAKCSPQKNFSKNQLSIQ